jgi:site-specific DNA-methyltransferase (adenine-specific)
MCIKFSGIPKGSRVYDPFIGTGTTILAAVKNGMYGVGTDIDQDYLSFCERRLENTLNPKEEKKENKNILDQLIIED